MNARLRLLTTVLVLALCVCGSVQADSGSSTAQDVGARIGELLSSPALKHGIQGVLIVFPDTQETLYERNADTALIPASNMKLVVAAAALARLGPDFNCRTEVLAAGRINERGVLEGDLIIKGGGDPSLSTADLRELARRVRNAGIVKVRGAIVADESEFDERRLGRGWSWDDEPYYYSAQISALCLNRNTVQVWVYPARIPGAPAAVRTVPPTNTISIKSAAVTGPPGSEKSLSVTRQRGVNVIVVDGSVPAGFVPEAPEASITIEDPALYAADVLRTELSAAGVLTVGGIRRGSTPADAVQVAAHLSPPLSQMLRLLNKPSDNLIAEVLLKKIGREINGKGSTDSGIEAILEVLADAGVDTESISIADGSGLSRLNFLTARSIVQLLTHMTGQAHFEVFAGSLPVAGIDGTLRNRMKSTPAEGVVRAKTGYLSRVSTLSGYARTRSGRLIAFSLLMNNHLCPAAEARTIQDRICVLLAGLP